MPNCTVKSRARQKWIRGECFAHAESFVVRLAAPVLTQDVELSALKAKAVLRLERAEA